MEMSELGLFISSGVSAFPHRPTLHWSYLLLLNGINKDDNIT